MVNTTSFNSPAVLVSLVHGQLHRKLSSYASLPVSHPKFVIAQSVYLRAERNFCCRYSEHEGHDLHEASDGNERFRMIPRFFAQVCIFIHFFLKRWVAALVVGAIVGYAVAMAQTSCNTKALIRRHSCRPTQLSKTKKMVLASEESLSDPLQQSQLTSTDIRRVGMIKIWPDFLKYTNNSMANGHYLKRILSGQASRALCMPLNLEGRVKKPISSIGKSNFVKKAVDRVYPSVVKLNLTNKMNIPLLPSWILLCNRQIGTGIMVDGQRGIIVTNAHVAETAKEIQVTFSNGSVHEGSLIAAYSENDLAFIQVHTTHTHAFPQVQFGDSDEVEVGDWAIAIGHPAGLEYSVNLGIISSKQRSSAEVGCPEKKVRFLQTDCPVNPGNSGGPLINDSGEVVGILTCIRGDSEGIAFAIASNDVTDVTQRLVHLMHHKQPYLGVQIASLRGIGWLPLPWLDRVSGVLVTQVDDMSPARGAGVQVNDVLDSVNGSAVVQPQHAISILDKCQVGQPVSISVWRKSLLGRKKLWFSLQLAAKPLDCIVDPTINSPSRSIVNSASEILQLAI